MENRHIFDSLWWFINVSVCVRCSCRCISTVSVHYLVSLTLSARDVCLCVNVLIISSNQITASFVFGREINLYGVAQSSGFKCFAMNLSVYANLTRFLRLFLYTTLFGRNMFWMILKRWSCCMFIFHKELTKIKNC